MSILIKGMEMPKNCDECDFVQRGITDWCYIAEEDIPCNCPLIEVPPHGRLIDADALMNDGWTLHKQVMHMGSCAIHIISLDNPNVPIVIPADKDGET